MRLTAVIIVAGFSLAGCIQNSDDALSASAENGEFNGEAAYLEHCAGCHDDGAQGAPRIGEPSEWESRSSLWQAVLMEHAKQGYYDMPARGGKPDLPDQVVNAAAEYMLEKTFPERPED
jgi:cytochrome c5